jgi:uncharacterized protein (DUF697 family)
MKEEKVKVEPKAEATAETESMNVTKGREERLEKLSKHHILASMGVGLIPVPIVDVVALMGVQLNMIRKLAAEYGIPFKQDRGKSIITSLVGGLLSTELGLTLCSLIKCIPVIGQTTGAVTMPVMSGAITYAIYKVFVQHFESGGTFLDLDPSKVKAYFTEQFAKGKKIVTDLKADDSPKAAA